MERIDSAGGVVVARGVEKERLDSTGGIAVASGVAQERIDTAGGVKVANGVENERIDPAGGVLAARGVASERTRPQTGVELRRSNPRQSERVNERNYKDGKTRSSVSRMLKHIEPSFFLFHTLDWLPKPGQSVLLM